jgi:hypothetical protein
VRNVGGSKLKVADTSRMQAFTSRTLYDRYNRIHYQHFGPHTANRTEHGLAYQGARLQLFRDYDIMDNDAIIASALDIYSDETTIQSEMGESLVIESPDENIREILHNLFYDILNIEFNLWPWIRNMCKYGDFFLFLEITEKYGIVNVLPLSVYDTIRVEGENPANPYEVYFQTLGVQTPRDRFENYEIAHFRLLADSNFLPYGKAMIEPARRTWKQLQLMEDAMLVHRLVRAPDRRIFKVDIGNLPPLEVDAFMERLIKKMQKTPLIDPQTGDYNLKFNLMNVIEDFYLPVRGGDSGTQIENLSGLTFNATEDVEYLRNKMIGSLKVPRPFLGYEEQIAGKATLAAEDVRFARTIERIQRIVLSELTKIAIIHLFAQGHTDESLVNFSLDLTNPSTIYEQEKIQLWSDRVRLATEMQNSNMVSSDWIYDNVFGMSEDEVEEQRNAVVRDKKRLFRLQAIERGEDPANAAGTQGQPGEAVPGEEQHGADEKPAGGADLSGLPSAEAEPEAEQEGVIADAKVGRPREGAALGTDRHYLGRDPFGRKENQKALHRDPEGGELGRRRKGLARESLELKQFVKSLSKKLGEVKKNEEQLLAESKKNSYMDEEGLNAAGADIEN